MNSAYTYNLIAFNQTQLVWAIGALAPLLGFVLLSIFKIKERVINAIAISTLLLSALSLFFYFANLAGPHEYLFANWFSVGIQQFQLLFLVDETAILMLGMIQLITLAVLVFSTAYMKGEDRYGKYVAYILLFFTSMQGLVLSNNLIFSYACWEMVGFCSYALIGFWRTKELAILANKKAFLINRIGDLGFLAGIFFLYAEFQTLSLQRIEVLIASPELLASHSAALFAASISLLIAVIAKSAQFPLHVWLPDAMEGPTPISALIHAATMVIAGIYLLLRISFFIPSEVLEVLSYISIFSILLSAFFAIAQYDIKKILAYSTISQVGYMLLAIAVQSDTAALFHLLTHAFFKAGLFLAAGIIIHHVHHKNAANSLDVQDIRNMNGLKKELPNTFWAFSICAASLVGLPFFSGCLSKDAIIAAVWFKGNTVLSLGALLSVFLSAVYVSRLWFFLNKNSDEVIFKVQESKAMLWPVILLAAASFFFLFSSNPLHQQSYWIGFHLTEPPIALSLAILVLTFSGFTISYLSVVKQSMFVIKEGTWIQKMALNGAYIDQFYWKVFVLPLLGLSNLIKWIDYYVVDTLVDFIASFTLWLANASAWFDDKVIDGLVRLFALISKRVGDLIRLTQTGRVQTYFLLAMMLLAMFAYVVYL